MADDKDWGFGDWDGRPSLYSTTESHACIDGKTWESVHPAEIANSAKVMTRDAFETAFPHLPPYPPFPGSTARQDGSARSKAAA